MPLDSVDFTIPEPANVDWEPPSHNDTGYPDELAANDSVRALRGLGSGVIDFPDHLWIDESDWKDKARENDTNETWPRNYSNRFTNQGSGTNPIDGTRGISTHECVSHSLIQNAEICWNRQRKGLGDPVLFSCLSIYAEANPGRWGGTYLQKCLGIALERGILPQHQGMTGRYEQRERFAHTIHSTEGRGNQTQCRGDWLSVSNFPSGWRDTARHFKPVKAINPSSWMEIVCLVLNGFAVSVGRSGHAIPYVRITWDGGNLYAEYKDSYDVYRYDSVRSIKNAVGGAFSLMTLQQPDDYAMPAGEQTIIA